MTKTEKFYVDGAWVSPASDQRIDIVNPATAKRVGSVALGSLEDAELAIVAARKAFPGFATSTRDERLELLGSIGQIYKKRIGEVAEAICTEMGAPLESLAKPAQAGSMLGHLKVAASVLKNYQYYQDNGTTRIQREPIGVCGMITPWNWPIHQIGCKVIPALATGCTMVLKPSEFAPLSALVFADILHEAGVPAGVFNLVNGDGPTVGSLLASHPEIDFVSFTGSTQAGVKVSIAAAPTVKKVALELGGKSANVLLEDANFSAAVTGGVAGMMHNTGQSCNAPSRMLVPQSRLREVEEIALAAVANVKVGDPRADGTTMGPLANGRQFRKVQELIQVGVDEGAQLICGGTGRPDGVGEGFFAKPTIFSRVDNNMKIAREEIFGPVLCVIPYENEDQAVAIANDTDYGLSGYVSSKDLSKAHAVASQLRSGNVHVNGAGGDLKAAFGGYKKSGLGREWGQHGFEEYLEIKSIFGYSAR